MSARIPFTGTTARRTTLAAASVAAAAAVLVPGAAALAASPAAGPASVLACGSGDLAVTASFTDSGAGHSGFHLLFRNTSSSACSLHGYPGLDALGRHGTVLRHAKRTRDGYEGGGRIRTVVVRPGHFAYAVSEWLNFNPHTSGDCRYSKSVAVTPPNTSDTRRLPVSVSLCQLQIHPTVAGTGLHHYGVAQEAWIAGETSISADQGRYWTRAANALAKDHGEWGTTVHQLRQLASLPDSGLTRHQEHVYHRDVTALDSFFVTPGAYL